MNLQHLIPPHFFDWCEACLLGNTIKNSQWDFAILETFHIIGIAVLLGATLIVNLRLLGFGLRSRTASELEQEFEPWTLAALAFMLVTGVPMFFSEAVRMSLNGAFFIKMLLL